MWSERVCPQCQADLGHGPGPLCGPCTLARHGTTLDPAQQASAASIPALRAVIAGVLKDLDRALTTGRAAHVETALSGTRTLASACERLAEENERLREEVARLRKAQPQPAPSKNYTLLGGAITPAPAGKGEG